MASGSAGGPSGSSRRRSDSPTDGLVDEATQLGLDVPSIPQRRGTLSYDTIEKFNSLVKRQADIIKKLADRVRKYREEAKPPASAEFDNDLRNAQVIQEEVTAVEAQVPGAIGETLGLQQEIIRLQNEMVSMVTAGRIEADNNAAQLQSDLARAQADLQSARAEIEISRLEHFRAAAEHQASLAKAAAESAESLASARQEIERGRSQLAITGAEHSASLAKAREEIETARSQQAIAAAEHMQSLSAARQEIANVKLEQAVDAQKHQTELANHRADTVKNQTVAEEQNKVVLEKLSTANERIATLQKYNDEQKADATKRKFYIIIESILTVLTTALMFVAALGSVLPGISSDIAIGFAWASLASVFILIIVVLFDAGSQFNWRGTCCRKKTSGIVNP